MKKLLLFTMVLTSIMYVSCAKSEEGDEDKLGSVYGIVTKLGTAEPMKAVGVELYKRGALLLKTVTFDDGHFEFKDLNPENYQVKVVADGYEQIETGNVTVEAGRQARIDLQVKKLETGLVVHTTDATVNGTTVTLNGALTNYTSYLPSEAGFVYATDNTLANGTLVKCEVASSLSITLTDMSPGQYYYQAYAKNYRGIVEFGEVRSFTIQNPYYVIIDNLMIQTEDLGYVNRYAAEILCKDSRVAGYSDWRLPTLSELRTMYYLRSNIPNLKSDYPAYYWSSDIDAHVEAGWTEVWCIDFEYGRTSQNVSTCYVRAVRTIN